MEKVKRLLLEKLCRWLNRVTDQRVYISGICHNSNGTCIAMSDGKQLDMVTSFSLSYYANDCGYGRISLETIVGKDFYTR